MYESLKNYIETNILTLYDDFDGCISATFSSSTEWEIIT